MSAVIDKAPVVSAPAQAGRHPVSAVLALARFEARELLLRIPVFVFLLLYVGQTGWKLFSRGGMDDYPVLHHVDCATQSGPMFLDIAVLVSVNVAVLRSRRHDTDRHFDTLVMEPWRRTLAHALSVVPIAAVTALVVAVEFGWAALQPGAVGHGSVAELAVGPLVLLLCGVLGVLTARVIPSVLGGPVVVVIGFVAFMVAPGVIGPDTVHWLDWLQPYVWEGGLKPIPSGLLGRPAAWHVLYLAGLTALLLCVAVLLNGRRTRLLKAVTAVALAATVGGIAGQSPSHEAALTAARDKVSHGPAPFQSCETHGRSTYCSFPEWTGWRDDWARVVDRVQSLAGGRAQGARLTIRQRIPVVYDLRSDSAIMPLHTPGEVTAGTLWGGNRVPEFAVGVASVLVAGDEESAPGPCDARVVTVMWLALAAQDDPKTAFRNVRLDDSVEGSAAVLGVTDSLSMSAGQTRIVRELLERPRYSVTARVKSHWTELTSPKTSRARVAELLGVPAAEGDDEEEGELCRQ
ncbi:ABC transporter permease [Streptomyces colonosanans]|uniref:ABC transporter permease n=1 Tax=Streptomyces colonosanans TaxID=1428652 RepID=A0A1S2Q7B2_9ACTN|nr:ABC transporter permease [Streptomyces colonosanans]OIK01105.1 ABC transporter permease [Streptomyces colonosanans]